MKNILSNLKEITEAGEKEHADFLHLLKEGDKLY
jgi:hypothetical protein